MSIPVLVKKIIDTNPDCAEILDCHGKIYTFLNPVSYLEALKNRDLYTNFDGIFVDGKFLAVAIGLFYHKRVKRCSFDMTSFAPKLFAYSECRGKSIYIVAGQQEEIDRAITTFTEHYPKLNIVGARNGYFDSDQAIDIEIKKIVKINPDFVICGMGAIKQENFLLRLKLAGYKGVAFTCGGFISQTSISNFIYYPRLFDILNLRFVYRMIKEKHTRMRYLQAFFCFPMKFVWEHVRSLFFSKNSQGIPEIKPASKDSVAAMQKMKEVC